VLNAKILCVTNGLPGMLYSSVELARRLAAAGHRLTYGSYAHARELVEHQGLGFLELEPSRYDEFLAADAESAALRRLLELASRRERAIEATATFEFGRAVRGLDPDLLLIDGEMHEHIIAASALGIPIALLNTFVSIWRRPGLPPPHCLVLPGVGWKGSRAGITLLWLALRLRKLRRTWWLMARRIGCDRLSLLRRMARDTGFDLRRETDASQWLIPFTYRRLPVLSLRALEFELPHRPPGWVRYIGPMVLESRIDRAVPDEDRTKLEAIFERRGRASGRRLIAVAFGSFFTTNLEFLRRLVEVVSQRPDWELVLGLSGRLAPAELGPLPDRVHAFSWLPQINVLRHADVMVNHGGINSVDECVLSGVPMLAYCGFETDMGGTTARVVHHGIGIAGDRRRDGVETIRGHIDRLLQEPHFREAAERLRRSFAAYAEQRVAERAVESLLGGEAVVRPTDQSRAPGAGS
jgi:UDP:flavonoid glycosyltransferase YjiC (YdhE family)